MFCCFPLLTVGDILLPGFGNFEAVFHCEDLFLCWSSNCSFTGVNCWSHPIFYGASYSSHHVVSFFTGVNGLSHPMVYGATVQATIIVSSFTGVNCLSHRIFCGANCLSHHVLSFFEGANCLSHPIFYGANCSSHHVISLSPMLTVWATLCCTVLTVQANIVVTFYVSYPLFFMLLLVRATMLLAFSRVLTVWATLFSMVLTVQATMFLAFSRVLNCLSHLIIYGAYQYCSSHHVISLSRVLTVWATLFCTVLTVQATFLLLVMWATHLFYGAHC